MGRLRKTYSETFKKKVAVEAVEGKKTVAEIAAANNVTPSMVSAWKKTLIEGGFNKELKKAQKKAEALEKENEAAKLEIGKLHLELELVKKKLNIKD